MGEYISMAYQQAARLQKAVCGLLFAGFSFVYLYVFQNDVLEALHYSLAHGKTSFAPMASAVVITAVLMLLRWGVNLLLGLRGEIRALAYFPSCLLLGVLTDVGREVYTAQAHTSWGWLLPLLLVGYAVVAHFLHRIMKSRQSGEVNTLSILNWNVFIVLMLCLMSVGIGNSNRLFHHELEVERCLRAGEYEKAQQVGIRSLEASRTLTALRGYALSRTEEMGEKLFQYPQYYGSAGLFFTEDSLAVLRYTNDSISSLLGVPLDASKNRRDFLHDVCYGDLGTHRSVDYYLSALLLDKDIEGFVAALTDLVETEAPLPRYYREAILLYRATHSSEEHWTVQDSLMIQRFDTYRTRKAELSFRKEEKNWMKKEFGDTYWWYFDYQKE